jgi:Zn-dependent M16 (insulinase) family peptidase
MWRQIRGRGYAYSYSMELRIEHGLLYFRLSNATHIFKAFEAAQDIVVRF